MNLATLYSVPLWQGDYPNFDEDKEVFISAIEEYKNQNPSIKKSNIFGYHSPETLHHVSELEPLFQYICQMAFNACQNLDFIECDIAMTSAWLNVNNTRQCMNSEHIHEDTFSGVFYLKVPEGSGSLAINNPSINKRHRHHHPKHC